MASGLNIEQSSPEMSHRGDYSSPSQPDIESVTTPSTQYSKALNSSPTSTRHRHLGSSVSIEPSQYPDQYPSSNDLYDPPFAHQCLLSFGKSHYIIFMIASPQTIS
jgi:hypothetical protein